MILSPIQIRVTTSVFTSNQYRIKRAIYRHLVLQQGLMYTFVPYMKDELCSDSKDGIIQDEERA